MSLVIEDKTILSAMEDLNIPRDKLTEVEDFLELGIWDFVKSSLCYFEEVVK